MAQTESLIRGNGIAQSKIIFESIEFTQRRFVAGFYVNRRNDDPCGCSPLCHPAQFNLWRICPMLPPESAYPFALIGDCGDEYRR
jgi:hypothetical protein